MILKHCLLHLTLVYFIYLKIKEKIKPGSGELKAKSISCLILLQN